MTSSNPYTGSVRLYGWQNGLLLGLIVSALISILATGVSVGVVAMLSMALIGSVYWHVVPTVKFFFK